MVYWKGESYNVVVFLCNVLLLAYGLMFFSTVRMGSLAMDMRALLGKDLQWKTSTRPELMVLMAKLLVYLEYLMVSICDSACIIVIKKGLFVINCEKFNHEILPQKKLPWNITSLSLT